jgi:hypothetical protein
VGHRDGPDLLVNQETPAKEESKELTASRGNKDLRDYRDCQGLLDLQETRVSR